MWGEKEWGIDGAADVSSPDSTAATRISGQPSPLIAPATPPKSQPQSDVPVLQPLQEGLSTAPLTNDAEGHDWELGSSRQIPGWEVEARMYHESLGHSLSFADLHRLTTIGDPTVAGIPSLDVRSADLKCPTCMLRKARSILRNKREQNEESNRGIDGMSARLMAAEKAALQLPAFEPDHPTTPPLSPDPHNRAKLKEDAEDYTQRGSQYGAMLGVDFSLLSHWSGWSGLANTCGVDQVYDSLLCTTSLNTMLKCSFESVVCLKSVSCIVFGVVGMNVYILKGLFLLWV